MTTHTWVSDAGSDAGTCSVCFVEVDDVHLELHIQCPSAPCEDPGADDGACVFVTTPAGAECSYCGREGAHGDAEGPDGAPREYDRDNLPPGPWGAWRRTRPMRMAPLVGPATVSTRFGDVELEDGVKAWVGLDVTGAPFLVGEDEHRSCFEIPPRRV